MVYVDTEHSADDASSENGTQHFTIDDIEAVARELESLLREADCPPLWTGSMQREMSLLILSSKRREEWSPESIAATYHVCRALCDDMRNREAGRLSRGDLIEMQRLFTDKRTLMQREGVKDMLLFYASHGLLIDHLSEIHVIFPEMSSSDMPTKTSALVEVFRGEQNDESMLDFPLQWKLDLYSGDSGDGEGTEDFTDSSAGHSSGYSAGGTGSSR